MNLRLTEEQEDLRASTAAVARKVYAGRALEWDREHTHLPAEERRRLADLGYLGIAIGEEWGGAGGTLMDALIVIEELAKQSLTAAFQVFEANTGPARVIELFGTDEQRRRLLPSIVRGHTTMSISISEPEAGSAATDLRAHAEHTGDHLVLNGQKRWCSGGGIAEQYLVYVRMDDQPGARGIGAVLVHKDQEGVTFGPQERLMGFHGIPSADIFFDHVRVPKSDLVVPAGGFKDLFGAFSIERLGNATMSLAMAQASLDRTARYVTERAQFGRPIVEFQAVHLRIADMLMEVEAARLLIRRAANPQSTSLPDPLEVSVAKCFANEMAKRVTAVAIELHGGYGYHPEYHVERHHRDALGWAIAGGTPAMQRTRIASGYLGRRFDQRG